MIFLASAILRKLKRHLASLFRVLIRKDPGIKQEIIYIYGQNTAFIILLQKRFLSKFTIFFNRIT